MRKLFCRKVNKGNASLILLCERFEMAAPRIKMQTDGSTRKEVHEEKKTTWAEASKPRRASREECMWVRNEAKENWDDHCQPNCTNVNWLNRTSHNSRSASLHRVFVWSFSHCCWPLYGCLSVIPMSYSVLRAMLHSTVNNVGYIRIEMMANGSRDFDGMILSFHLYRHPLTPTQTHTLTHAHIYSVVFHGILCSQKFRLYAFNPIRCKQ